MNTKSTGFSPPTAGAAAAALNGLAPPASMKRAYSIFAVVGLALLMSSIDSTIVAVGLKTLMTDLRTNLALIAWTMTGYQFAQSITMPIAGKLSDEWGRKRIFLAAVVLFTLSSMAAGLAPNIYFLIVFRVLQGIGGGTFMPSATGIVSDAFGNKRAQAIGLFGSIFPIGGIIGPNLGGLILDHFSWRWIFFVNVPVGVLLVVFGSLILPKGNKSISLANHKMDVTGLGLFVGAVFALLYGITSWADNPGKAETVTWLLFGLAAVLFFFFVRHENRAEEPIIDMKLLRWRPFLAVNVYNFIFGMVVFGLVSYIPYYATVAYGMTPGETGVLLTPRSLAMIAASTFTSFFIIRFRYRPAMIVGMVLIATSLFLLSQGYHSVTLLGINLHDLVLLSSVVAIFGVGMGIANPASNNAALDLIPEKVAAVTGMRGMSRSIGGVLGTASVALILAYFPDQAKGMQYIYLGFVAMLVLLVPVVFMIPDSARDRARLLGTNGNGKKGTPA